MIFYFLAEYQIVFIITCIIFVLGAIVYGLFATAEIQPWAVVKTVEDPVVLSVEFVAPKETENSKL